MATTERYHPLQINKEHPNFSPCRMVVETAFYGNNVTRIDSMQQAYELAKEASGTIVSDYEINDPESIGLDPGSKVLVFNDGRITGRTPKARKNLNRNALDYENYVGDVRQALFLERDRRYYHASAYVGTHHDFMVKAHLLVPEGWESLLYQWLLNFEPVTADSEEEYLKSMPFKDEGDIYLLAIPDYLDPAYPIGLSLFEGEGNCGAILGLNTFVEYKKGTLSLAWAIAERRDFIPVHGGQKRYQKDKDPSKTVLFIGLTGSGKSVLTNHKHTEGYEETVLHDDALIISANYGDAISMERGYFEKTDDCDLSEPRFAHLLSAQNQGVIVNHLGEKMIVAGDLRNENGRVLLSEKACKNRVFHMKEAPSEIFWIIKDPVLPPVIKVTDPILALSFAGTLSNINITKSDSDLLKESEPLSIQPFGNPFRTYPAVNDYHRFKKLIEERKIESYIFNTGYFMGREISKELTISVTEQIIAQEAHFVPWKECEGFEILEILGYQPDFSDASYKSYFVSRLKERIAFLEKEEFPAEAIAALEKLSKGLA